MREFERDFELKGLRPIDPQRNSEWLEECYNFKATPLGLEAYTPLTQVYGEIAVDWPFPQLLQGKMRSFLIVRDSITNHDDRIYLINADWSLTLLATIDWFTYGVGGVFDFADFGEYCVFFNGTAVVTFDFTTATYLTTAARVTFPVASTGCNFNGQLVAGAVRSVWLGRGINSLIWSGIGDIDFTPGRKNTAGFKDPSAGGEIQRIKKLGKDVIAYAAGGIGKLSPVTDPAPTFAYEQLTEFPLCCSTAVGGNEKGHVFVSNDGWLCTLGKELKRVGFKDFIAQLDMAKISIACDDETGEYFISDGERCFLYNSIGMTEVHQLVGGIGHINGSKVAVMVDNEDIEGRILTEPFDGNIRGIKTSTIVEASFDSASSAYAEVRVKSGPVYFSSGWIPMNDQGVAAVIAAGSDLKVGFKVSNYLNSNLDALKLRYKISDLRSIRGVYAPPKRGQGVEYA